MAGEKGNWSISQQEALNQSVWDDIAENGGFGLEGNSGPTSDKKVNQRIADIDAEIKRLQDVISEYAADSSGRAGYVPEVFQKDLAELQSERLKLVEGDIAKKRVAEIKQQIAEQQEIIDSTKHTGATKNRHYDAIRTQKELQEELDNYIEDFGEEIAAEEAASPEEETPEADNQNQTESEDNTPEPDDDRADFHPPAVIKDSPLDFGTETPEAAPAEDEADASETDNNTPETEKTVDDILAANLGKGALKAIELDTDDNVSRMAERIAKEQLDAEVKNKNFSHGVFGKIGLIRSIRKGFRYRQLKKESREIIEETGNVYAQALRDEDGNIIYDEQTGEARLRGEKANAHAAGRYERHAADMIDADLEEMQTEDGALVRDAEGENALKYTLMELSNNIANGKTREEALSTFHEAIAQLQDGGMLLDGVHIDNFDSLADMVLNASAELQSHEDGFAAINEYLNNNVALFSGATETGIKTRPKIERTAAMVAAAGGTGVAGALVFTRALRGAVSKIPIVGAAVSGVAGLVGGIASGIDKVRVAVSEHDSNRAFGRETKDNVADYNVDIEGVNDLFNETSNANGISNLFEQYLTDDGNSYELRADLSDAERDELASLIALTRARYQAGSELDMDLISFTVDEGADLSVIEEQKTRLTMHMADAMRGLRQSGYDEAQIAALQDQYVEALEHGAKLNRATARLAGSGKTIAKRAAIGVAVAATIGAISSTAADAIMDRLDIEGFEIPGLPGAGEGEGAGESAGDTSAAEVFQPTNEFGLKLDSMAGAPILRQMEDGNYQLLADLNAKGTSFDGDGQFNTFNGMGEIKYDSDGKMSSESVDMLKDYFKLSEVKQVEVKVGGQTGYNAVFSGEDGRTIEIESPVNNYNTYNDMDEFYAEHYSSNGHSQTVELEERVTMGDGSRLHKILNIGGHNAKSDPVYRDGIKLNGNAHYEGAPLGGELVDTPTITPENMDQVNANTVLEEYLRGVVQDPAKAKLLEIATGQDTEITSMAEVNEFARAMEADDAACDAYTNSVVERAMQQMEEGGFTAHFEALQAGTARTSDFVADGPHGEKVFTMAEGIRNNGTEVVLKIENANGDNFLNGAANSEQVFGAEMTQINTWCGGQLSGEASVGRIAESGVGGGTTSPPEVVVDDPTVQTDEFVDDTTPEEVEEIDDDDLDDIGEEEIYDEPSVERIYDEEVGRPISGEPGREYAVDNPPEAPGNPPETPPNTPETPETPPEVVDENWEKNPEDNNMGTGYDTYTRDVNDNDPLGPDQRDGREFNRETGRFEDETADIGQVDNPAAGEDSTYNQDYADRDLESDEQIAANREQSAADADYSRQERAAEDAISRGQAEIARQQAREGLSSSNNDYGDVTRSYNGGTGETSSGASESSSSSDTVSASSSDSSSSSSDYGSSDSSSSSETIDQGEF